ncbi:serine/threonine-protein kinase [Nonomuraea aurantiaca]|uniref:serine/threonine-protein kinase n=1 Tax=Nonomuraea aurantiaca TaxID=2878562 RepID=UPI001CD9B86F|nr:serine/threonine-protein kinase [Nonomuraea aurantiaca]MCA2225690.1 serine/threonine protein kinase [Nonomuraea aurantiaca]
MSDPGGFGPLMEDEHEAIGPYRIVGRMGAGGMGVVYAGIADDGSRVAVKVIHPGLAADPQFLARFVREVDLLSRVQGRCTVSVLAADTAAMPPWLATEFVPGPTVSTYVQDNAPLPPDELLSFGVDIAEALTDIHRAGIVHRDLKPGNVILSASGAKVLDFGIARALDESGLTGTGALIGSPGWISPEQYRGDQADAAADVFAWGALMAYASTGRPPFGTGAPDVLAYRVMSVDPDLSGVPARVRDLVRSALAKDRTARPASDELLAQVTALRAGTTPMPPTLTAGTTPMPPPPKSGTIVMPPPVSPPANRVPLWPAAAVLATIVAIGALVWVGSEGIPEALRSLSDPPTSTPAENLTPDTSATPTPRRRRRPRRRLRLRLPRRRPARGRLLRRRRPLRKRPPQGRRRARPPAHAARPPACRARPRARSSGRPPR